MDDRPRFAWRIIGPPWCGKYRKAVVFHDAAYQGKLAVWDGGAEGLRKRLEVDRKWVDMMFYDMMLDRGVNRMRAWAMYRAVWLRAGKIWRDYRKGAA